MISQEIRKIAPEMDPLRMGMGWKAEDLEKPQILIESTFGDSHPGSAHLLSLANGAAEGVAQAGGKGARYFATDICDGMAQGHDGINYSLAYPDIRGGVHFNLSNNLWGTNFQMWNEGSLTYRFKVEVL